MSDAEARPGVYLDTEKRELIVCTDFTSTLDSCVFLNLETMKTRSDRHAINTFDTNDDCVSLPSFKDLVLECNKVLGNPLGVAKRPATPKATPTAKRTTTKPAPPPPKPPQPPLIKGPAKYDAFWHEKTQTLIYATDYNSTSTPARCKWCTVRLQPDGRVVTTANDVPVNVYTSFAARPSPFQNYDQKAIVQLLYYGHKPLRVYLEAMFKGEVPPAVVAKPVAPSGTPPGTPPAADPKAAIAFFFEAFTSQNGVMTDAEFGRYQQFVRAAHDHQDVRRPAESQINSLDEVIEWHDSNGGTTDRLPEMMHQFRKEWNTFMQAKEGGENVARAEGEDETKNQSEDEANGTSEAETIPPSASEEDDPAADVREANGTREAEIIPPSASEWDDTAADVRRLDRYLQQRLGQDFELDDAQKAIATDLDLNDPTQFYRCIVQCLDNEQLLTILWQRPQDIEMLTDFLHDIKRESDPDDLMSVELYVVFTCIVNDDYRVISSLQITGASLFFVPEENKTRWTNLHDSAKTSITAFVDTVYGTNHALREKAATKVRNFKLRTQTAHVYQLHHSITGPVRDYNTFVRALLYDNAFVRALLYFYDDASQLSDVFTNINVMHEELRAIVDMIDERSSGATDSEKFNVYFQLYTWRDAKEWPKWQDGFVPKFNFVNLLAYYNNKYLDLEQDQSQGGRPLDELNGLFKKLCEHTDDTDMRAEQIAHYYRVVDKDDERNDLYPLFWQQAVASKSVSWPIFRRLYHDAQFATFARTDIAQIQDSYELPKLVNMVFARFATGTSTRLPYDQLQAIFQSAELHDKLSEFREKLTLGNEDVAQGLTKEQFTQGIAEMPGIAIPMAQQLMSNEKLLKKIFDYYANQTQFMTLDQLNTCLQGTGETLISAQNFTAFCTENKLVEEEGHFQIRPPAITIDGFIVYFSQTKNMDRLKALDETFEEIQRDNDEDFDGEEY